MENQLFETVKDTVKNWWVSLLVGILAIIVGVWCLCSPDATLVALTMVFIIAFLIGGILEIVYAVSNAKIVAGWGWSLASGIIDILFALLLMILPTLLITTLLIYFVGFWILFRSIWAIGEATELQRFGVRGWGWLLALAILSVLLAFVFMISPLFGGIFIVAFVGVAFISFGIFRIYRAFLLKSLHKYIKKLGK